MAARRKTRTTLAEATPLGFNVSTYSEYLTESNARDKIDTKYGEPEFRRQVLRKKWMTSDGSITEQGWKILNEDITKIERNALAWLRRTFLSVRDDGHDRYGDVVGTVWADPHDVEQKKLIDQIEGGLDETVDLDDVPTAFKGVSDFGQVVLGGAIHFGKD